MTADATADVCIILGATLVWLAVVITNLRLERHMKRVHADDLAALRAQVARMDADLNRFYSFRDTRLNLDGFCDEATHPNV